MSMNGDPIENPIADPTIFPPSTVEGVVEEGEPTESGAAGGDEDLVQDSEGNFQEDSQDDDELLN